MEENEIRRRAITRGGIGTNKRSTEIVSRHREQAGSYPRAQSLTLPQYQSHHMSSDRYPLNLSHNKIFDSQDLFPPSSPFVSNPYQPISSTRQKTLECNDIFHPSSLRSESLSTPRRVKIPTNKERATISNPSPRPCDRQTSSPFNTTFDKRNLKKTNNLYPSQGRNFSREEENQQQQPFPNIFPNHQKLTIRSLDTELFPKDGKSLPSFSSSMMISKQDTLFPPFENNIHTNSSTRKKAFSKTTKSNPFTKITKNITFPSSPIQEKYSLFPPPSSKIISPPRESIFSGPSRNSFPTDSSKNRFPSPSKNIPTDNTLSLPFNDTLSSTFPPPLNISLGRDSTFPSPSKNSLTTTFPCPNNRINTISPPFNNSLRKSTFLSSSNNKSVKIKFPPPPRRTSSFPLSSLKTDQFSEEFLTPRQFSPPPRRNPYITSTLPPPLSRTFSPPSSRNPYITSTLSPLSLNKNSLSTSSIFSLPRSKMDDDHHHCIKTNSSLPHNFPPKTNEKDIGLFPPPLSSTNMSSNSISSIISIFPPTARDASHLKKNKNKRKQNFGNSQQENKRIKKRKNYGRPTTSLPNLLLHGKNNCIMPAIQNQSNIFYNSQRRHSLDLHPFRGPSHFNNIQSQPNLLLGPHRQKSRLVSNQHFSRSATQIINPFPPKTKNMNLFPPKKKNKRKRNIKNTIGAILPTKTTAIMAERPVITTPTPAVATSLFPSQQSLFPPDEPLPPPLVKRKRKRRRKKKNNNPINNVNKN